MYNASQNGGAAWPNLPMLMSAAGADAHDSNSGFFARPDGSIDAVWIEGSGSPYVLSYTHFPAVAAYAPADFDHDGDVDSGLGGADDFDVFQACVSGPAIPYNPSGLPAGCSLTPDANGKIAADFDKDGDVDHDDFAVFQGCVSGEELPADPSCAN